MSLLFRHLRIHSVFGANTDVGKTILTTALVRASATNHNVFYLKPVSTGNLSDADDSHIRAYAASKRVSAHCLYQYDEPVSPHLAAQLSNRPAVSDETLVNAVASYVRRTANSSPLPAHLYVETAGGVHSPTLSGTTQADAYRPLFLPIVLIGDSNLGGISTTISAYESLLLRGYIVDAVLLFRDTYYRNYEYLKPYFADRGIWLSSFEKPPPLISDPHENFKSTDAYYQSLLEPPSAENGESVIDAVKHLSEAHSTRLAELDSMPRRTLDSVWWPFVQHAHFTSESDVNVIDSARSDFFSTYTKDSSSTKSLLTPQLDSSASWWTQTFGHAHIPTTLAAARAAGRYGHVMFPGATHLPALKLTEALLAGPGHGWAKRAFITDNGSTGMEVALKMALRAYTRRMGASEDGERLGVLGLTGSYHGDTIGAMDACEVSGVYTCEWHDAKGVWLDPPTIAFSNGKLCINVPPAIAQTENDMPAAYAFSSLNDVYDVDARLGTALERTYRTYIEGVLKQLEDKRRERGGVKLAVLVLEPLVMGAGGMRFVDPLFQRVMVDVVRSGRTDLGLCPSPASPTSFDDWHGLPIVYDEVFVGLYRLGLLSSGPLLGALPDISVNAKVLTGGLVPLSVTLARGSIFRAFWGESKSEALLHGHSYSAHAVGCEVAVQTLKELDKLVESDSWSDAKGMWGVEHSAADKAWSFWDPQFVKSLSEMDAVEEVMTLGCVMAIKVADKAGGTSFHYSLLNIELKNHPGYTSHAAQDTFKSLKDLHLREDAEHSLATSAPGGAPYSVHYRTLGNVAYFMTSLNTRPEVVREVEDRIWTVLNEGDTGASS
ncbi:hypothetical protein H0H92_007089 [Tricholoma furcatifolium]|nr:hypothetical protein H0H92_007089 [Tricholoma furcatifolium]